MRNQVRKAFTLVEILIVVVILGILAAIVIPQFTSATEDAQAGNIKAQLQSLQNQTELYRARNNSIHPFAAADWYSLIGRDAAGVVTLDAAGNPVPEYIKKSPKNPAVPVTAAFANDTVVVTATQTDTGSAAAAWVWNTFDNTLYASYFNEVTGEISQVATD